MKIQYLILTLVSGFLMSCGSISSVDTSEVANGKTYSRVVVKDFQANNMGFKVQSKVEMAKKSFPDMIAGELKETGKFSSVSRGGQVNSDTLVIDGRITEYEEGNAAVRMMVGMGAGTARFNADVNLKDSKNKTISKIDVDKNSWILGGALAASQTPETFMSGAAKKIAAETAKLGK